MKNSGSALSKTTTATRLSCSIVVSSSCRATIIAGSTRLIGGLSKVTRQYCGLCWVMDSLDVLGMVCSFGSLPEMLVASTLSPLCIQRDRRYEQGQDSTLILQSTGRLPSGVSWRPRERADC